MKNIENAKKSKDYYDNFVKSAGLQIANTDEQSKDILEELSKLGPVQPPKQATQVRQSPKYSKPSNQATPKLKSVLDFKETKRTGTSPHLQPQNNSVYQLNNQVLSQKYAELEGAVIKMQKQLEMIPILQNRIYQQEKEMVLLKSKVKDLENRESQTNLVQYDSRQSTYSMYPRRSQSSQQ